ncbi:hypothetical protein FZI85_15900 [Mycobacterium sp. CBMA293]|uniref:hypothetical protein n=1 Tax=unclassified Mycolicibacterium TaxID=2636767 RepID=UPI001329C231|nr:MULTISPECIES: hypothetical protein [unclassified Mycolicibacterium]MUL46891.1 hypothetical protein [Mycolicibacterium sp. CBMA 360]MUL92411.1 hypothetical protein [Mycolicibacterium sp. CBMA 230]MUL57323.1 hypothetical protein [Mycolicibacterium sp. CBMA 335]MUL70363.1 hypothetical protein [Mycolicibacterium sp. CBMA 311]MUM04333.1 hypothetical protein [Mycolicibacterium sp. CBMA 213]
MSEPTIHPPAVRRAGFLVAAEGVLGLIGAAVYVVRGLAGADQHVVSGYGNAIWLVFVSGAVLAGGWALITGRRWGRGIGVFANLLLLGIAWYVFESGQLQYAIVVALVALVALGLLFSPSAVHWVSKRD